MIWLIFDEVLYLATNLHQAQERSVHIRTYAHTPVRICTTENVEKLYTFLFPEKAFFHLLIGMTDTFFALYWRPQLFFNILLFHNPDGDSGLSLVNTVPYRQN